MLRDTIWLEIPFPKEIKIYVHIKSYKEMFKDKIFEQMFKGSNSKCPSMIHG